MYGMFPGTQKSGCCGEVSVIGGSTVFLKPYKGYCVFKYFR